jgi:hypothetical protein
LKDKKTVPQLFLIFSLTILAGNLGAISWPVNAGDDIHYLGNSYGEYQRYGGYPYFHPGIDILAPPGTPVYAVKAGYVKAILTISAELHWRVAIGDSAGAAECDGWLYAHLDEPTIAVYEGQWVEEGQYLGGLVYWPVANFHHLHFVKIRNSGVVWNSDWEFITNPLDELDTINDPDGPEFELAYGNQLFAFCQNESSTYFAEGESISGDVDIISRSFDYINHYAWELAPHKLEYKIEGDSSTPWVTSVCFTGELDFTQNVDAVYQDDAICDSRGDYDYRWYYFNVTNTDGDSLIEAGDRAKSWQTANFHNGDYEISVRAHDRFGNSTTASMNVTVENYFTLAGTVTCYDGNPHLDGSVVTILSDGLADTTDGSGGFALPFVGGGSQLFEISRIGYETSDTILMMNQNQVLEFGLVPGQFVLGDANFDNEINIGDAVYIINFVFRGGYSPIPYAAGDANSDGTVDIGDAVYLINYIFRDGPPPHAFLPLAASR